MDSIWSRIATSSSGVLLPTSRQHQQGSAYELDPTQLGYKQMNDPDDNVEEEDKEDFNGSGSCDDKLELFENGLCSRSQVLPGEGNGCFRSVVQNMGRRRTSSHAGVKTAAATTSTQMSRKSLSHTHNCSESLPPLQISSGAVPNDFDGCGNGAAASGSECVGGHKMPTPRQFLRKITSKDRRRNGNNKGRSKPRQMLRKITNTIPTSQPHKSFSAKDNLASVKQEQPKQQQQERQENKKEGFRSGKNNNLTSRSSFDIKHRTVMLRSTNSSDTASASDDSCSFSLCGQANANLMQPPPSPTGLALPIQQTTPFDFRSVYAPDDEDDGDTTVMIINHGSPRNFLPTGATQNRRRSVTSSVVGPLPVSASISPAITRTFTHPPPPKVLGSAALLIGTTIAPGPGPLLRPVSRPRQRLSQLAAPTRKDGTGSKIQTSSGVTRDGSFKRRCRTPPPIARVGTHPPPQTPPSPSRGPPPPASPKQLRPRSPSLPLPRPPLVAGGFIAKAGAYPGGAVACAFLTKSDSTRHLTSSSSGNRATGGGKHRKCVSAGSISVPGTWYYSSNHILINEERASRNLPTLRRSANLDAEARSAARAMANNGKLLHSDMKGLANRLEENNGSDRNYSVVNVLGENVGCGRSIREVHARLMKVEKDRSNILDARFKWMGIGTARTGSGSDSYGNKLSSATATCSSGSGDSENEGCLYVCQLFKG